MVYLYFLIIMIIAQVFGGSKIVKRGDPFSVMGNGEKDGRLSDFLDGFLWCCDGLCGMICISYKIWPFIWFLFASMSEALFKNIYKNCIQGF